MQKDEQYYLRLVEKFNTKFDKLNNTTPQIPSDKECEFIFNFITEELDEFKEAYESKNLVEVLDAFCDIQYVLNAGILAFGLQDKFTEAYEEVQASNMSKSCATLEIAEETVRFNTQKFGEPFHYEKKENEWIVYRSSDRKVTKSITYFKPNLKQFLENES